MENLIKEAQQKRRMLEQDGGIFSVDCFIKGANSEWVKSERIKLQNEIDIHKKRIEILCKRFIFVLLLIITYLIYVFLCIFES